jgi:hypothetical protein
METFICMNTYHNLRTLNNKTNEIKCYSLTLRTVHNLAMF